MILTGMITVITSIHSISSGTDRADSYQNRPSVYQKLFPVPTGANGFEEYAKAVDLWQSKHGNEFENLLGEIKSDTYGPDGTRHLPPGVNKIDNYESVERKYVAALTGLSELIAAGNKKPVHSPFRQASSRADRAFDAAGDFPTLALLKALGKFEVHAATLEFARGQASTGFQLLLDDLHLGENLDLGNPISSAVSESVQLMALRAIDVHLPELSSAECETLEQTCNPEVANRKPEVTVADSMAAEHAETVHELFTGLKSMSNDPRAIDEMGFPEEANRQFKSMTPDQRVALSNKLLGMDRDDLVALKATLNGPFSGWSRYAESKPTASSDPIVQHFRATLDDSEVTKTFLEGAIRRHRAFAVLAAKAKIAAYQKTHGQLPEAVSQCLSNGEANDPFTGTPYIYKQTGNWFELKGKD